MIDKKKLIDHKTKKTQTLIVKKWRLDESFDKEAVKEGSDGVSSNKSVYNNT